MRRARAGRYWVVRVRPVEVLKRAGRQPDLTAAAGEGDDAPEDDEERPDAPLDRGIGPPANQQKPRRGGRERDENHYGIDIGDRRQLDLSRNELCDGTLARLGRRGDNAQLDVGDDTADDCRKQRDADRLRDVVASEDSGSEIGEPARNGGTSAQKSAMRR